MNKRLLVICILCGSLFSVVLYVLQSNQSAMETVKYFPLDKETSFDDAATTLTPAANHSIHWDAESSTMEPMYLRQDISLLYENGFFKGVQSKWREQEQTIQLSETFPIKNNRLLSAISYHHGEIHQSPDSITSIQKMTSARLYLNKTTQIEEESKQWTIKGQQVDKRLQKNWQEMMKYHDLESSSYTLIPLTQLAEYNDQPLPGFSDSESKEVIGKLWEGLYKNYIIRLKEKQHQFESHAMPLIMISKDRKYLHVLFELNGKKEILYQQL